MVILYEMEGVLPYIITAAALHEVGHLLALWSFGVHVEEMCFTAFGIEIRADLRYLSYWKDIVCTLAGPMANLLGAFFFARVMGAHLLGGANLLQGCFNLLPLTGLDGSRVLYLALCLVFPLQRAEVIYRISVICFAAVFTVFTVYLMILYRTGWFLLLALFGVILSIWRDIHGK